MMASDNCDPALAAALRALAEDDATSGASAVVEAQLRLEVRSAASIRRGRRRAKLSAAAALFAASAIAAWRIVAPPHTITRPVPEAVTTYEVVTAFLPLTYRSVPMTDGQLVRVELPRTALASFGLDQIESQDDTAIVQADVVVGEDGLARAVRFVRTAARQETR
jgi:hypothetical protein